MSEGRIVEFGRADDVLASPTAPYTQRFLSDTPSLDAALAASAS